VVPNNPSLLTIALFSSVITTPFYNDINIPFYNAVSELEFIKKCGWTCTRTCGCSRCASSRVAIIHTLVFWGKAAWDTDVSGQPTIFTFRIEGTWFFRYDCLFVIWTGVIYVKWFFFEVKWSEVKWVTVKLLGTKVPCAVGWPYSEGTWLYCD
jgi:hypothetical protein